MVEEREERRGGEGGGRGEREVWGRREGVGEGREGEGERRRESGGGREWRWVGGWVGVRSWEAFDVQKGICEIH